MFPASVRRFRFIGILTVAAVYLLILVGGVVRSTGSGMGCPDWPKCFGTWIPPTHVSQLPTNYREVYTDQRVAKNQRLATMLEQMGFEQVAGNIFAHPTQYLETDFNVTKTWIEYLNRLLGALIGVFVFLTAIAALPYWRRDRVVFWLAFGSFILVGVQGWLGSLVVSTNLLPVMVTIHMGLALVLVGMLLYAVDRSQRSTEKAGSISRNSVLTLWLWLMVLLTFGQIVLGTQVREEVDLVASALGYSNRNSWVEQLGGIFRVHRTFSLIVLLVNLYVAYRVFLLPSKRLRRLTIGVLGFLSLEILAGIVLAYLALPAVVQPVHLTVATLLFGGQMLVLITYRRLAKPVAQPSYPRVVA